MATNDLFPAPSEHLPLWAFAEIAISTAFAKNCRERNSFLRMRRKWQKGLHHIYEFSDFVSYICGDFASHSRISAHNPTISRYEIKRGRRIWAERRLCWIS